MTTTAKDIAPIAFTCEQIAALLQVSQGMIRKMIRTGEIKAFRVGKCWRVSKVEASKVCNVKPEDL